MEEAVLSHIGHAMSVLPDGFEVDEGDCLVDCNIDGGMVQCTHTVL